ncbi:MAG: acyl-CoA dehydrogenase family protein [Dehalococcoidia bacterium]|nr:acyl-CoA dehydrogenase family protein [Dehalococcoidia bacterium]
MKLDLSLNESEKILKKTASDFVKDNVPKLVVQKLQETDTGTTPDIWRKMADLGWLGIIIPEKYGGHGLTLQNAGVLMEALGMGPVPGPFFSSSVLASQIILEGGSEAQKKSVLPAVAEGKEVLTLAFTEPAFSWEPSGVTTTATKTGHDYILDGVKLFVMDAAAATHLIIAARTGQEPGAISLFLVDSKTPGISIRRLGGFMAGRSFEVKLDAVKVPGEALMGEEGRGWEPLKKAIDKSIPVLCAYKVGGCQAVYDMCLTYSQQRVQFGQKIGRFQYVAGMVIEQFNLLEAARWTTAEALWKADTDRDMKESVHVTKAVTSDAYWQTVTIGHQVISGVSFSKEHELTFHLRASRALYHYLGDPSYHRWKLAKALV